MAIALPDQDEYRQGAAYCEIQHQICTMQIFIEFPFSAIKTQSLLR